MSEEQKPKRGRKSRTIEATAVTVIDPLRLEAAGEAAQVFQQLAAGYGDDRDLANQLLGQAQMANAIAKLSDVVTLSKLKQIKDAKLYRALAGKSAISPDGKEISDVGTFEGFCQALGLSYSKVHEDLQNLDLFGQEALQNLSQLGVGYRELRQYRRLPEDQRSSLIEVAKAGDKEGFVELAEEIMSKHVKDIEAKDKEIAGLREESAAKDKVVAQGKEHIAKLVEEKARRERMTEAELLAELERDLAGATLEAVGSLMVVRSRINAICALDKLPRGLYDACKNALQRIDSEVMDIADGAGIECEWHGADWLQSADGLKVGEWLSGSVG